MRRLLARPSRGTQPARSAASRTQPATSSSISAGSWSSRWCTQWALAGCNTSFHRGEGSRRPRTTVRTTSTAGGRGTGRAARGTRTRDAVGTPPDCERPGSRARPPPRAWSSRAGRHREQRGARRRTDRRQGAPRGRPARQPSAPASAPTIRVAGRGARVWRSVRERAIGVTSRSAALQHRADGRGRPRWRRPSGRWPASRGGRRPVHR
jgi:hypothetical protein